MTMINKATIEGRLERPIDFRTTPQGKTVAELRIATEREWKGANGTSTAIDYHTVVAWEALAEQCRGFREGDMIYAEGRLQTRSWEDKDYPVKHYRTEVIAYTIKPAEGVAVDEETEEAVEA